MTLKTSIVSVLTVFGLSLLAVGCQDTSGPDEDGIEVSSSSGVEEFQNPWDDGDWSPDLLVYLGDTLEEGDAFWVEGEYIGPYKFTVERNILSISDSALDYLELSFDTLALYNVSATYETSVDIAAGQFEDACVRTLSTDAYEEICFSFSWEQGYYELSTSVEFTNMWSDYNGSSSSHDSLGNDQESSSSESSSSEPPSSSSMGPVMSCANYPAGSGLQKESEDALIAFGTTCGGYSYPELSSSSSATEPSGFFVPHTDDGAVELPANTTELTFDSKCSQKMILTEIPGTSGCSGKYGGTMFFDADVMTFGFLETTIEVDAGCTISCE